MKIIELSIIFTSNLGKTLDRYDKRGAHVAGSGLMVKVLEVFIREGDSITSDKHSGTNSAKMGVSKNFSRTVNVVTKKNWPCVYLLACLG